MDEITAQDQLFPSWLQRIQRRLAATNPIRIALEGMGRVGIDLAFNARMGQLVGLVSAGILVLGLFGALHAFAVVHWPKFDLDAEWNVPAFFSGGLLFAAAWLASLLSAMPRDDGANPAWWGRMSVFFFFMGCDEIFSFLERLETLTGIDWQLLYIPVVAIGAVAWFFTLRCMWGYRVGHVFYIAGAGAWFISQVFDRIAWSGSGRVKIAGWYNYLMIPEEVGEMAGSALFGFAMLVAIRHALRKRNRLA